MDEHDVWGRVSAVASALGWKNYLLRKWKSLGGIPALRHKSLVEKAKEMDIPISYDDLNNMPPGGNRMEKNLHEGQEGTATP